VQASDRTSYFNPEGTATYHLSRSTNRLLALYYNEAQGHPRTYGWGSFSKNRPSEIADPMAPDILDVERHFA
jgi:hypothetical protein